MADSLNDASETAATWELTEPTNLLIATVKRTPSIADDRGYEVRGEAKLTVPSPPRNSRWIAFIVDTVIGRRTDGWPAPFFADLHSFYRLVDVHIQTTLEVGGAITRRVAGPAPQFLKGPDITLRAVQCSLSDFVCYPEAKRATDASARSEFSIGAMAAAEVERPSDRRDFIKRGIVRMLAADGYVDFEEHVDKL